MVSPNRPSYTPQRGEEATARSSSTGLLLALVGLVIPGLIAYGMGTTNDVQVLSVVIGCLGIIALLARPYIGLVVFVGLLFARPEESIKELDGMHFTLIVGLMTLLGMVMQMLLNREKVVRAPTVGMIIGFACIATFSLVVNTGLNFGFIPALDFDRLVVLVILILNLVRAPETFRSFVTVLIVFTCYLAFYSMYLYATGQVTYDYAPGTTMGMRTLKRSIATGIFSDPNDLAATMVAGLSLALARCVLRRGVTRILYGLLCAVLLWAILLTNSRGGVLALVTVVFCFFVMFSRRKKLASVLGMICAALVLFVAPSRMTNFDSGEGSANSRFHYWEEGIHQMARHPIWGIGYNRFPDVNDGMVAHNSFVTCFAEEGLVGYFFWMSCIYFAFMRRKKGGDAPTGGDSGAAELTAAHLALIGYLSAAFWITRTYSPVIYIYFTLPVAQQIAYSGNPTLVQYTPEERLRTWGRICLVCIGSIILIYLMVKRLK